jgi:muramidase (phage lysozyme)
MKKIKLDAGAKKAILLGFGFFGVILGLNLAGVPLFGIRRRTTSGGSSKWKYSKYPLLWDVVLRGESFTYNDFNRYAPNLKSAVKVQDTLPFSNKPLTKMTLAEVKDYQNRSRSSSTGQLWATGRFQIIPSTLSGVQKRLGLSDRAIYDEKTQSAMADALIDERSALRLYLNGKVSDTSANRKAAALDISRIWSSVGIPYNIGNKKYNQSYYSLDKASVPTELVQETLQKQRKALGN